MGLGRLLTRSTVIQSTDTITGATATFTITDNLGPDWPSSSIYQGFMSIPGAWRAAILLSDLLGQVPWNAFRQLIAQPEVQIQPNPPLLEQPHPPDTRMSTFSSWALDLIWHGNAIGVIAARNPQGWPTAVIPVPARFAAVRRIQPFMDSPLPVGALEYSIGELRLGADEVMHIKGPCESGFVRGMGVLETQLNTLTLASDLGKKAQSVTRNGVPTGILESSNPDLTDDEALNMKTKWVANQRDNTIAVLNSATKFTPLSWNPEQMQLVEARKMSLNEMELVFGLPVGWLGGMNSARQYSNIEQDAVNLLKFSLSGHLARFEQTLSLQFPRGTQVRADLDSILRADTMTRYQAYAIALQNEFLDKDEVRGKEHLPPMVDDNDDFVTADHIADVLKKMYPAVGTVLSPEEARKLANRAGAGLTGPAPKATPPPAPAALVPAMANGMNGNGNGAAMMNGADSGSQSN